MLHLNQPTCYGIGGGAAFFGLGCALKSVEVLQQTYYGDEELLEEPSVTQRVLTGLFGEGSSRLSQVTRGLFEATLWGAAAGAFGALAALTLDPNGKYLPTHDIKDLTGFDCSCIGNNDIPKQAEETMNNFFEAPKEPAPPSVQTPSFSDHPIKYIQNEVLFPLSRKVGDYVTENRVMLGIVALSHYVQYSYRDARQRVFQADLDAVNAKVGDLKTQLAGVGGQVKGMTDSFIRVNDAASDSGDESVGFGASRLDSHMRFMSTPKHGGDGRNSAGGGSLASREGLSPASGSSGDGIYVTEEMVRKAAEDVGIKDTANARLFQQMNSLAHRSPIAVHEMSVADSDEDPFGGGGAPNLAGGRPGLATAEDAVVGDGSE